MSGSPWHGLFANFAELALFLAAWTFARDGMERWNRDWGAVAFGAMMGTCAVALMRMPVELQPGVFVDLRMAPVALAGFFGGPFAGGAAFLLAGAYRLSAGGAGAWAGVASIGLATAIALLGHLLRRGRGRRRIDVLALAIATAGAGTFSFLLLPSTLWPTLIGQVALPFAVVIFVSMLASGLALIEDERRRVVMRENETYRTIIEAIPDCLNVKDLEGRFIAANPATAALMRAPSVEALIGRTDFDFYPEAVARRFRTDEEAVLRQGQPIAIEQPLTGGAGRESWLSTLKVPLRDRKGTITGIITHNRDVTRQKWLQGEWEESQRRLSYALAEMSDGLAMFDLEGRLVFCNPQYQAFFPRTGALRVPGARMRDILWAVVRSGEQIGAPQQHSEEWIDTIAASLHKEGAEEIHLADGRWLHLRTRPAADGSSLVVVSDVTSIKTTETALLELTGQLKLLATIDGLTGLLNRRAFDQAIETELARSRAKQTTLSLLMIDVDGFKAYNDRYGHPAGDECLRRLSACFGQTLRPGRDIGARYGGEEFTVILPDTEEDGAFALADRIRTAVRSLDIVHEDSATGVVTVSIGLSVTTRGRPVADAAELIARADAALYQAKTAGRNRINGWRTRISVGAHRAAG